MCKNWLCIKVSCGGVSMNRQSANEKEKIDRHIVLDIDSEENFELFERLGKALSSRVRIRMLALLNISP